jgi:hypothetical protein
LGWLHKDKTIWGFWRFVYWTDEFHIDPSAQSVGYIYRERGHRLDDKNIQERGGLQENKLHVAGWVNWPKKCEKLLEFYNVEEEHTIKPKMPRKPRKSKYEHKDQFQEHLREWEAQKPHEQIVNSQGNGMTQEYYVKRLLPVYVSVIQHARLRDPEPWILQEDNDSSHGHKTPRELGISLAEDYKDSNWIPTLVYLP